MGGSIIDSRIPKEFFDDDVVELRMAVSDPNHTLLWVEPEDLKLKQRIGRGPFGDVWIATLHSYTEEFDEFHEVAVKMLPLVCEEQVKIVLSKFNRLFQVSRCLKGVNWPRGVTKKNGKVCIVMKFYEGSLGDKMAHRKGNRLPLTDVLRYGLYLAYGIIELHSTGILALNLKPCNFLLDDQDKVILGDFGIPMLLLGSSSGSNDAALRLGTPNYMAPEQWDPEVRGPLSFETDSWAFGCSIIEMLTGLRPWHQHSPEDIFTLVVTNHEKPRVPNGLPPALDRILRACFEYDYRHRPSFNDIVLAFQSPDVIFREGDWVCMKEKSEQTTEKVGVIKRVRGPDDMLLQFFDKKNELVHCNRNRRLSSWKKVLNEGDLVRLKNSVLCKDPFDALDLRRSEGTVVGIDKGIGAILVKFSEFHDPLTVNPSSIERVSSGFIVGDLVRLTQGWSFEATTSSVRKPSVIGMVHEIEDDGKLKVAFLGCETLWSCNSIDLVKMKPFNVGQYVRIRAEVASPRFQWPLRKNRHWDTGKIVRIAPNGGLIVYFPGHLWNRDEWWADPEDVEVVSMNDCIGLVEKYQHLEAMHWSVRPLIFMLGLFATLRAGSTMIGIFSQPCRRKKRLEGESAKGTIQLEVLDVQTSSKDSESKNSPWLPSVADIWFREGLTTS